MLEEGAHTELSVPRMMKTMYKIMDSQQDGKTEIDLYLESTNELNKAYFLLNQNLDPASDGTQVLFDMENELLRSRNTLL